MAFLMHNAGIAGLPGPAKVKRIKRTPQRWRIWWSASSLGFELDELWVTDITEHPTREGKVYCCCRAWTPAADASSDGRSIRSKTPSSS